MLTPCLKKKIARRSLQTPVVVTVDASSDTRIRTHEHPSAERYSETAASTPPEETIPSPRIGMENAMLGPISAAKTSRNGSTGEHHPALRRHRGCGAKEMCPSWAPPIRFETA